MTESVAELAFDPDQHQQEVLAWRAARVRRLTEADSWLSLIGKHWLTERESSVGSDPGASIVLPRDRVPPQLGTFVRDGDGVRFEPAAGVALTLRDGQNATERALEGPMLLRTDAHGAPDRLQLGSVSLEVMERAGEFAVRTRDTESPARRHFPGIDYFPIDPSWRVVAKLERYEPEKVIELAYETGTSEAQRCPYAAVFERDGVTYRVDPVIDGSRPRLFYLFWDLTCRDESYGASRFLYAPLPKGDHVVLDFNQAFSPPCAFTPYAACPLPPLQNRLAVRIEAGEKKPREIETSS